MQNPSPGFSVPGLSVVRIAAAEIAGGIRPTPGRANRRKKKRTVASNPWPCCTAVDLDAEARQRAVVCVVAAGVVACFVPPIAGTWHEFESRRGQKPLGIGKAFELERHRHVPRLLHVLNRYPSGQRISITIR
jgi:hypothetical protein